MPYCHACGSTVDESVNFCPECGADQARTIPRSRSRRSASTGSSLQGQFWTTALVGGTIGFFLALFFAAVVTPLYILGIMGGAAVGGYLHARGESAGLRVGALSGAFASVPVLFFIILGALLGFGGFVFGAFDPSSSVPDVIGVSAVAFLFVVVLMFALVANVLFGALGGYVGAAMVADSSQPIDVEPPEGGETNAKHDR